MGTLAVVTHAAVSTAIANTIGGKDVPEFTEMVGRMMGEEESEQTGPTMAAPDWLTKPDEKGNPAAVTQAAKKPATDFKPF